MKQNTKFLLIFSLSIYFLFPIVRAEVESEETPKPMLLKGIRAESKKELDQDSKEPKEKMNLLKTYKEENTGANGKMNKENTGAKSCTETLSMMEKRVSVMDENLKKRKSLVTRIQEKLNTRIQNLKSRGLNTSKVEASLTKYVTETENVLKQREGLTMVLADLTRFDCSGDPVNFKNNLKDFNQRFKNQNLEFNRINKEFRVNVLYELSNLLSQKVKNSETKGTEQ